MHYNTAVKKFKRAYWDTVVEGAKNPLSYNPDCIYVTDVAKIAGIKYTACARYLRLHGYNLRFGRVLNHKEQREKLNSEVV